MSQTLWTTVDQYFNRQLLEDDPVLTAALEASAAAGLPAIAVAANQGKMLHLMAKMAGARRILEVGTLGGYSTIWLARALPAGGRLVSLELDPTHAETARANLAHAGLSQVAEVRLGPAAASLETMAAAGVAAFDFVFIDADKPSNADYFAWAIKLSRPGTTIVVDNVVRKGAVAEPGQGDANVEGVRRLAALIAAEPRVSATAVQTVGDKGYDGFILAVVDG